MNYLHLLEFVDFIVNFRYIINNALLEMALVWPQLLPDEIDM
mgnify:CR=1 FL=1